MSPRETGFGVATILQYLYGLANTCSSVMAVFKAPRTLSRTIAGINGLLTAGQQVYCCAAERVLARP